MPTELDLCKAGAWNIQPDVTCPVCGALPDTECRNATTKAPRQPHQLDYTAEPQQSAIEACVALVAHYDEVSDDELEAAIEIASTPSQQDHVRLVLAARRALTAEGYRS